MPNRPNRGLPRTRLLVRCALGGSLMGLANLVPGISGGTMLLATGIYPRFVTAVAELTTLRLRLASVAVLGAVGAAAAMVIVALAGPIQQLVLEHRWAMYSLFIGLTLGGVPILLRLAHPATGRFWAASGVGFALMVALALTSPTQGGGGGGSASGLFVGGVAGAAAMVLPGVSGGYLLLLLGQYLPILAGIDALKRGLLLPLAVGGALDPVLIEQALRVALPVGLGVGLGIAAVSNAVRLALDRAPQPTLGILLGLVLGAGVGLWPFQRAVPPAHDGSEAALARSADPETWPLERYPPGAGQAASALALLTLGLATTVAIGRLGNGEGTESG